jgi:hypothetical protein
MSIYPRAIGVHLLPATGEWAYDTVPYIAAQHNFANGTLENAAYTNTNYASGGSKTDYSYAIDQLQAAHSECQTVSIVCAWFFSSEDASSCQIYPSTIYLLGEVWEVVSGSPVQSHWMVSGLTEQNFPGIIPIPTNSTGSYVYGGTPSDPSIVRCLRDLKSRGFRVVFYPFLLGTGPGFPWRGRISFSPDVSSAATTAANAFLGSAAPSQFVRDTFNLTVAYTGNLYDWTYRRMILHYANLCVIAGGVDLFVIGSELRGLETIRGPGWTKAGTTDANGKAVWDYPFVAGLVTLANDVRSVFDGAGLTKNMTSMKNLITYSADWSDWMGVQHLGASGQWPHLDSLYASSNIDVASLDNYMPLSDWTTGTGGLDVLNWSQPAPSGSWPPSSSSMSGLGLSGVPTISSVPYLKANIEGGQYYNWYYNDGANDGRGWDPNGSGLTVSLPEGDRLSQSRNPYFANQQILANKQARWWWKNTHRAVYDTGDGQGWIPRGPTTEWTAWSKSIIFLEYGFSSVDKGTNQPNVFFDPKSVESFTPFWSIWDPAPGLSYLPRRDDTIAALALEAVYEYWNTDGHNERSGSGVPFLQTSFCCVWNWDVRPFPTFPVDNKAWGDTGNWPAGDWFGGLRQSLPPPAPSAPPSPGTYASFPTTPTLGWSAHLRPRFATDEAQHVSGRSTRRPRYTVPVYDVELTYEVLRGAAVHVELQAIVGFFEEMSGQNTPFWIAPPELNALTGQALGTGDGLSTFFPLTRSVGPLYTEFVQGTSGVSAVYLGGVSQGSGWSVSTGYAPGITFTIAPAAGVAITADFGVLFLSRFAEDVQDFEEFMTMLWRLRTLRLTTVRP